MRVLLTGAHGQLAHDIAATWTAHEIVPFSREVLDVSDGNAVHATVQRVRPDCIVNTAAFHFVDVCESRWADAFAVNVTGVANLANAAQTAGATFVQLSTDYVFDGSKRTPYVESDATGPLSTYAISRVAGEWAARHYCEKTYVVRTCGLYGLGGANTRAGNFVETMVRLARAGKPIRAVNDQIVTPTSTLDLSRALLELVTSAPYGLYHATNTGECSWYEFAREIFRLFGLSPDLKAVTSVEYHAPAIRPQYSVLDNAHLRAAGIADLRDWHEALADYVQRKLESGVRIQESGR